MKAIAHTAYGLLVSRGGDAALRRVRLWESWAMVMGEELAPLAIPLGARDTVLHIGAEDSMVMQELFMQAGEILERVNAFMEEAVFSRVQVTLLMGKEPLHDFTVHAPPPVVLMPPRPADLGELTVDPDSAMGRCYLAYIRSFQKADEE